MVKKIKSNPGKIDGKIKRSHHKKTVPPIASANADPVIPDKPAIPKVDRRSWRERFVAWWD